MMSNLNYIRFGIIIRLDLDPVVTENELFVPKSCTMSKIYGTVKLGCKHNSSEHSSSSHWNIVSDS